MPITELLGHHATQCGSVVFDQSSANVHRGRVSHFREGKPSSYSPRSTRASQRLAGRYTST
jgi:hypothetical protein